jgi:hypothetical protein
MSGSFFENCARAAGMLKGETISHSETHTTQIWSFPLARISSLLSPESKPDFS